MPLTLKIKGELRSLERPMVMGILNVTPDSFYAASRRESVDDAMKAVRKMVRQRADIIDVGACSTRPGSESVSADVELERLAPVLDAIREEFQDLIISVDTFHASVARTCLERWKVDIINDVSFLSDPEMGAIIAQSGAVYVLMHTRGTPAQMQTRCEYDDVTADVITEIAFKLNELRREGVCDVIIDPGFGFAKTVEQNYKLLKNLEAFKMLECPVMVGISRKSMMTKVLDCGPSEALNATIALNTVALTRGADILRVHDVRAAADIVKLLSI